MSDKTPSVQLIRRHSGAWFRSTDLRVISPTRQPLRQAACYGRMPAGCIERVAACAPSRMLELVCGQRANSDASKRQGVCSWGAANEKCWCSCSVRRTLLLISSHTQWCGHSRYSGIQRSLQNAPIFRLLLKVAVNGTHQCDLSNFCGAMLLLRRRGFI